MKRTTRGHFFKIPFLLLLGLMVAIQCSSSIDPLPLHHLMKRQTKYCGSDLANALNLACDGDFYPGKRRRSDLNFQDTMSESEESRDDFGFLNGKAARFFFKRKSRSLSIPARLARGVYNECCQRPCHFETLRSYCNNAK